jgi:large subunit ribosomal protein L19
MQKKIIDFNQKLRSGKKTDYQSGDVVRIFRKIKEGDKERIQVFEGLIIAVKGRQSSSPMITVRKVTDGVGVELILPVLSPNIEKIELVKKASVRRSKLYYVRGESAKKSRMKYKDISEYITEEKKVEEPVVEGEKEAEVVSEKAEEEMK